MVGCVYVYACVGGCVIYVCLCFIYAEFSFVSSYITRIPVYLYNTNCVAYNTNEMPVILQQTGMPEFY